MKSQARTLVVVDARRRRRIRRTFRHPVFGAVNSPNAALSHLSVSKHLSSGDCSQSLVARNHPMVLPRTFGTGKVTSLLTTSIVEPRVRGFRSILVRGDFGNEHSATVPKIRHREPNDSQQERTIENG